jgi:hypothetical protein
MLIVGMKKQQRRQKTNQRRQKTNQRQVKTIWVVVVYTNQHLLMPTGIITSVRGNELFPGKRF